MDDAISADAGARFQDGGHQDVRLARVADSLEAQVQALRSISDQPRPLAKSSNEY